MSMWLLEISPILRLFVIFDLLLLILWINCCFYYLFLLIIIILVFLVAHIAARRRDLSSHVSVRDKKCVRGRTPLYQVWPKGWQITLKRGVVLLTWPIFVCTAVQNLHCTRWFAINCVLGDGYWVSHLGRSTLVLHTLRLKLHRFDFSLCLLQTCLYNI